MLAFGSVYNKEYSAPERKSFYSWDFQTSIIAVSCGWEIYRRRDGIRVLASVVDKLDFFKHEALGRGSQLTQQGLVGRALLFVAFCVRIVVVFWDDHHGASGLSGVARRVGGLHDNVVKSCRISTTGLTQTRRFCFRVATSVSTSRQQTE